MASIGPYLLGRTLYRGARYLGTSFARSLASRAAGAAAHSVGGMVQNAIRRRRRARAWRTMKAYRQSAALGLGLTRYLSSVKCPFDLLRWSSGDITSYVLRFSPMYYGGVGTNYQYAHSLYKCDERFVAMCGLYNQWRILNVYYMISISGTTDSFGDIGIFARIIRNGNKDTPITDFVTSQNFVSTPGIIWKRQTETDRRLSLTLNVAPKSILEKSQWYTTDYNGFSNVGFLNGVETDFCPMIDVCVYGRSAPTAAATIGIESWYRVSVEFRDASDASGDSAKTLTVDLEPAKKEVKVSEAVEP